MIVGVEELDVVLKDGVPLIDLGATIKTERGPTGTPRDDFTEARDFVAKVELIMLLLPMLLNEEVDVVGMTKNSVDMCTKRSAFDMEAFGAECSEADEVGTMLFAGGC